MPCPDGKHQDARHVAASIGYSDLAIETTLTLGLVFGLRLRQAEGLLE
jgi:hypothetical protein